MKKIRFNFYGLLLFFIIMIPNFIWFIIKAPNDILRNDSITPNIDLVASIFQVIMVILLCFTNKKDNKFNIKTIVFIILYFFCWIFYYLGIDNNLVIIGLCLFPCLAFLLYEDKIKNYVSMVPTIIFMILHLLYGFINFM